MKRLNLPYISYTEISFISIRLHKSKLFANTIFHESFFLHLFDNISFLKTAHLYSPHSAHSISYTKQEIAVHATYFAYRLAEYSTDFFRRAYAIPNPVVAFRTQIPSSEIHLPLPSCVLLSDGRANSPANIGILHFEIQFICYNVYIPH